MTVKEAINESMEKNGDTGAISICFPNFLMGMASILCAVTDTIIDQTPDYRLTILGEEETFYNEDDRFLRLIPVLGGKDFLRSATVFLQLQSFMSWYLEQDATISDDMAWFDAERIAQKWNEYAEIMEAK